MSLIRVPSSTPRYLINSSELLSGSVLPPDFIPTVGASVYVYDRQQWYTVLHDFSLGTLFENIVGLTSSSYSQNSGSSLFSVWSGSSGYANESGLSLVSDFSIESGSAGISSSAIYSSYSSSAVYAQFLSGSVLNASSAIYSVYSASANYALNSPSFVSQSSSSIYSSSAMDYSPNGSISKHILSTGSEVHSLGSISVQSASNVSLIGIISNSTSSVYSSSALYALNASGSYIQQSGSSYYSDFSTQSSSATISSSATYSPNYVLKSGDIMSGSLNMNGNYIQDPSYIQYLSEYVISGSGEPGKTYWDTGNHTLSTVLENGVVLQHGQEVQIYGKNISGSTISNGCAVSIIQANGQFTAFGFTDITNVGSAYSFVGLATQDIIHNDFGYVTTQGQVRDIDTSSFTEGKAIYVSASPGKLTSSFPTPPNYLINVGVVEYSHQNQGRINVITAVVPKLQDLSDVDGTPLNTTGQVLLWNDNNKYFDASSSPLGSIIYQSASAVSLIGLISNSTSSVYSSSALYALNVNSSSYIASSGSSFLSASAVNYANNGAIYDHVISTGSDAHGLGSIVYQSSSAVNLTGVISNSTSSIYSSSANYLINSPSYIASSGSSFVSSSSIYATYSTSATNYSATGAIASHISATGSSVHGLGSISIQSASNISASGFLSGSSIYATTALLKNDFYDINRYGFLNRTETSASFNGSETFILNDSGSGWSYWRDGYKYTTTGSRSVLVSASMVNQTLYYIYIDATTGNLTSSNAGWTLNDTKVPVATLYWDSTLTPKYILADERHQVTIDRAWHREHHFVEGTRFQNPGTLSGLVPLSSNPGEKTFGISGVEIFDEDLKLALASLADPDGATPVYYILYRTSATTYKYELSDMPFKYAVLSGTPTYGYIEYDLNGTSTQMSTNNRYCNTYVFASNSVNNNELNPEASTAPTRYFIMQGRNFYTSAALATAETFVVSAGMPVAEGCAIWQLTWTNSGIANSVKGRCQFVSSQQVRANIITTSVPTSTNHNGLTGLQGGNGLDQYYHLSLDTSASLNSLGNFYDNSSSLVRLSGSFTGSSTYSAYSSSALDYSANGSIYNHVNSNGSTVHGLGSIVYQSASNVSLTGLISTSTSSTYSSNSSSSLYWTGSQIYPQTVSASTNYYLNSYNANTGLFTTASVVSTGGSSGGVTSLSALSDVSITGSQTNGQALVWSSASSKWYPGNVASSSSTVQSEYIDQTGGTSDTYGILSGLLNGSNKTFTVSQGLYQSGTLRVFLNGQLLIQGTSSDWIEKTPASGTFDINVAPQAGDQITAVYGYVTNISVPPSFKIYMATNFT